MPPLITLEVRKRQLLVTDQDPVSVCIAFVRNVVILFLALYRVFKSLAQMFFDSPAETDYKQYDNCRKTLPRNLLFDISLQDRLVL